jgi:hypothetical protein
MRRGDRSTASVLKKLSGDVIRTNLKAMFYKPYKKVLILYSSP